MHRSPTSLRLCLLTLLWLLPAAAVQAAEAAQDTGYRVKVSPFTGVALPHQQLSAYQPSLPLGLGFEARYTPHLSLALEGNLSHHRGGPGGERTLQLLSVEVLGRWHFPQRRFAPFLQFGVGGFQAEVDGSAGRREFGGAGLALGVGAERPLVPGWTLQLSAKTHVAHGTERGGDDKRWIGHSRLQAWLCYRLP